MQSNPTLNLVQSASANTDVCTKGQPNINADYISYVDQKQINLQLDSSTILLVWTWPALIPVVKQVISAPLK